MENKRWGTLRENGDGSTDLLVNGDVYSDGGTNRLLGKNDITDSLDPESPNPISNHAASRAFVQVQDSLTEEQLAELLALLGTN